MLASIPRATNASPLFVRHRIVLFLIFTMASLKNLFTYVFTFSFFLLVWTQKPQKESYPGTYLIVAPRSVRPNLPYSVSVNILDTKNPILLDMKILDDKNKTIAQSKGMSGRDFKKGQGRTVSFEKLPRTLTPESKCRLVAVGKNPSSGKVLFEKSEDLTVEAKSRSTFIQTDKAIYKPGSLVHFRVVVVMPDLKPYKGKANIKISDPNENVIKQFTDQPIEGGVLGKNGKLSLQLSEEPPLGDWKITADVDGDKTEKTFTVDKYVLPKFDVSVKVPQYVGLKEDIPVVVIAKYTYGKGVIGRATVEASIPSYYFSSPSSFDGSGPSSRTYSKNVDLDSSGETKVLFTRAELKEHKMEVADEQVSYSYSIEFTAAVTEKLTGAQRNGSSSVGVYKHVEQVTIDGQADSFKPGMDYNITVTVASHYDTPLPSAANKDIFLTITYRRPVSVKERTTTTTATVRPGQTTTVVFDHYDMYEPQTEDVIQDRKKLDSNGKLQLTLKPPLDATSFNVEARYGSNVSEVTGSTYKSAAKSPTHSYLQLLPKSASAKTGDTISFNIRTTKPVGMVTVQVMSKGYILLSKNVELSGQTAQLSFPATSDMAPKSRIIAYAVRSDNKEILVDAMDFRVEGLFKNNVSITVEPKRAEPNQTVTFTVKGAPNSYIGLLSVDQSVLLLKTGNDITSENIESEIASYDSTYYGRPWGPMIDGGWCRWCWWTIRGENAASVFDNSGVLVLTDAYLHRHLPPPMPAPEAAGTATTGTAPPMSAVMSTPMPMTQPAGGAAGGAPVAPVVRKSFPETWLWVDAVAKAFQHPQAHSKAMGHGNDAPSLTDYGEREWSIHQPLFRSNGVVTYQATVPDTITSWITSAFAVSDSAGLGVAPEPVKVEVFRPFFIRMDLPYSVKRGEKVALQVLAFNYMENAQKVTITLDNKDKSSFEFIEKPGAVKEKSSKQLNVRLITVPGGGASAAAYFPIIPKTVGVIKLLVTAIGTSGSDAVELPLIVEPEGFAVYKTVPFVLEMNNGNKTSKSVNLDIPKQIVPGSARAEFTVNGDIMAPVLNNIEQLIQMPYGCGEQNMLTFVPDIVVCQYFKATGRLTPAIEEKAKRFMESGYQRELTYQLDDASYSAFGKSDSNGSTWLTAFVTRAFKQARQFIYVDADKLKQSIKYLRSQQKENGVYEEHGMVHHKAMQGGASQGGVALAAYVLLTLVENDEKDPKGLSFLERSLDRIKNDSYSLAITTYALHLAKSAQRDKAYKLLENQAIQTGGQKHWSYVVRDDLESKEPSWWESPRPVDVETTAYALLIYVLRGHTAGALPIVRWLASKRNAFGGYSSTQDTVVALQALSAYASKVYSKGTNVAVTVSNGNVKQQFAINPSNDIVLQSVLLKELDKPIQLDATGQGVAYSQINYHYNVPKRNDPQPFQCLKSVKQDSPSDITIGLCCNYALKGRSNMVVIEANALSGYVTDEEELNKLTSITDIQRVEVEKGGTVANIYIKSLGPSPVCMNISSNRAYQVADQKPALINVYDYYDPGVRIEMDYSSSKQMTIEEVCGGDCWGDSGAAGNAAAVKPTTSKPTGKPKSRSAAGNKTTKAKPNKG